MSNLPLLPEDEARLRAERYVRDELEQHNDCLTIQIDTFDSAIDRLNERLKEARETLFEQQQADRNALADRCAGKGLAEIDRLFRQQAEVHYKQAAALLDDHTETWATLARHADQVERDIKQRQNQDRDNEGRGR